MIEKLTFLQIFALIFMFYEFIKMFLPKIVWVHFKASWFSIERNKSDNVVEGFYKKNLFLSYMGYVFMAFALFLLISQWWWISLSLVGLSVLTTSVLLPLIKKDEPFSSKIFYIMLTDFAFTILLLWQVVNPIELIK